MCSVINAGHIVGFLRETDVVRLTYSVILLRSDPAHTHAFISIYLVHSEYKQVLSFDHCVAQKDIKTLVAAEVAEEKRVETGV